jgi:hypothetical protein
MQAMMDDNNAQSFETYFQPKRETISAELIKLGFTASEPIEYSHQYFDTDNYDLAKQNMWLCLGKETWSLEQHELGNHPVLEYTRKRVLARDEDDIVLHLQSKNIPVAHYGIQHAVWAYVPMPVAVYDFVSQVFTNGDITVIVEEQRIMSNRFYTVATIKFKLAQVNKVAALIGSLQLHSVSARCKLMQYIAMEDNELLEKLLATKICRKMGADQLQTFTRPIHYHSQYT